MGQDSIVTELTKNCITHYYLDINFEIDYLNGPDSRGDFQRVWNKHVALNRMETIVLLE